VECEVQRNQEARHAPQMSLPILVLGAALLARQGTSSRTRAELQHDREPNGDGEGCSSALQAAYAERFTFYYVRCGLLQSDLIIDSNGKLKVTDSTKICRPGCADARELQAALPAPDHERLESTCSDQRRLRNLKQRNQLVVALDGARAGCRPSSTTAAAEALAATATQRHVRHHARDPPTTRVSTAVTVTSTTATVTSASTATVAAGSAGTTTIAAAITATPTTTPSHYDFTYYMETHGTPGKSVVEFPDGEEYLCCCRPDVSQKSVECVLHQPWKRHSAVDRLLRLTKGTCGGVSGGEWHSWNHVRVSKKGHVRNEFVGLENVGRCIVRAVKFPAMLEDQTDPEIWSKLHKARVPSYDGDFWDQFFDDHVAGAKVEHPNTGNPKQLNDFTDRIVAGTRN